MNRTIALERPNGSAFVLSPYTRNAMEKVLTPKKILVVDPDPAVSRALSDAVRRILARTRTG